MRKPLVIALITALVWAAPAPSAEASEIYPMVFPVYGDNYYSDTFGAPRSGGRTHEGIDIIAEKMTPVVAVASGTVGWMHNEQGGKCCAMELNHDDGWESWYIHLNNDTPGTDDGQGWGFAAGIEPGARVEAGQLIGWVGDSGNAENTVSHLHFELHRPDGVVINPYESLLVATDPALIDSPIERLAGLDRYRTAIEISNATFPDGAEHVFIATGENHPDSLVGIAAAAKQGSPILLTNTSVLNTYVKTELTRLSPTEITILGGPGAVSTSVESELRAYATSVTRLEGPTRFETAAAITSANFDTNIPVLYVVNGLDFPEAVIAGPVATSHGGAVLLTRPDRIPDAVLGEITRMSPSSIVVLERPGQIDSAVVDQLESMAPTTVIRGSDRYEVSAALSASTTASPAGAVYVAVGTDYPDALTGGVAAGLAGAPILLVETNSIPTSVGSELDRLDPAAITVLGGTGVVSNAVELELINYLVAAE